MTSSNSTSQESDLGNSTLLSEMEPSNGSGLTFAPVAMIIPAIVIGALVFVLIVFYIWQCYSNYAEAQDAEKAALKEEKANAKLEETRVPIAEPEDFTTASPPPVNDDTDVEDAS